MQPTFLLLSLIIGATASSVTAQDMRSAIDDVQPKMVKIYGAGGFKNLEEFGSGFVISADGYIVTLWSHLLDAPVISVVMDDGRRYEAELIAAEPRLELAVLKIDAEGLPFVDLNRPAAAEIGSRVLAFSNMYKVAAGDEPMSVLHGVVMARTELALRRGRSTIAYDGPVYVVDAMMNNSGAGGGLLTTRTGLPIGMIGRQLRNNESNIWLNYAIPLEELAPVVEQIRTGNFSRSESDEPQENPRLFAARDFGIILVPDVVARTPAYIDAIAPESLAADVDLQPDDLIVFVNDRLVPSVTAVEDQLGILQPTDDVTLVVRRGASLVTVTLQAPRRAP